MRSDYYNPQSHHNCMFCGAQIGKKKGNGIVALANKAHVMFSKKFDGLFIINCCLDCARSKDFSDQTFIDEIHHNVLKSIEYLDKVAGVSYETTQNKLSQALIDSPNNKFVAIEENVRDRPKTLELYNQFKKRNS